MILHSFITWLAREEFALSFANGYGTVYNAPTCIPNLREDDLVNQVLLFKQEKLVDGSTSAPLEDQPPPMKKMRLLNV